MHHPQKARPLSFVALCCALHVVACCFVLVCVAVGCAVSLGAVLRGVASCCSVRCSAVLICGVCVVLCCFVSRFFVPLRAALCSRLLCLTMGRCAARCCALLCCSVLCALYFVCFAVVFWLMVFSAAVRCAACVLWCRTVRSLSSLHFQNLEKTLLVAWWLCVLWSVCCGALSSPAACTIPHCKLLINC